MTDKITDLLARGLPWSIAAGLLFVFLSISFSQIFLGAALVAWLVLIMTRRRRFEFPPFFWGLIAYSGLSLVACFLSDNQAISFRDSGELLLFLTVPLVFTSFQNRRQIRTANLAILISAALSILLSLIYFVFRAAPGERIAGFMDHYMTQAGLLMLFGGLALSLFLFTKGKFRWIWGFSFGLAGIALILTMTRSAWVGLVVILCVLLALYKPKALILVPVAVGLCFLLSPGPIKRRALSIFSTKSYSNAIRIEYINTGLEIIRDYPLFGTGPNTVHVIFQQPKYNLSADARSNVHLHNNLLQIAAERGIPTMLVWTAFIIWAFVALIRMVRGRDPDVFPLAAAALAAVPALVAAGFFEYNFHDAEVTFLFLYLISVPFAMRRISRAEPLDG